MGWEVFFYKTYPSTSLKNYNIMLSLEIVQLLKPIYTATPLSNPKSISLVATCFQQSHYFQVVLSLLSPHPFHPSHKKKWNSAYLSISILLITRSYSKPCFQIWMCTSYPFSTAWKLPHVFKTQTKRCRSEIYLLNAYEVPKSYLHDLTLPLSCL